MSFLSSHFRTSTSALILTMLFALTGCGGGGGGNSGGINPSEKMYSNFVPGSQWTYRWVDSEGSQTLETWRIARTINLGDVTCLDLVIKNDWGTSHEFITASESTGIRVYAESEMPDGELRKLADPPAMLYPGIPARDYTSTTTIDGDSSIFMGKVLSNSETVTVPTGTYNNALHLQITILDKNGMTDSIREVWFVPGVGCVKQVDLLSDPEKPDVLELVSYQQGGSIGVVVD